MGCRAYVIIENRKSDVPAIYLYTQWRRDDLPLIMQKFLRTPEVDRWSTGYVAAGVFKALLANDANESIAIDVKENSYMELVEGVMGVGWDSSANMFVTMYENYPDKSIKKWSLEEYVATSIKQLNYIWNLPYEWHSYKKIQAAKKLESKKK